MGLFTFLKNVGEKLVGQKTTIADTTVEETTNSGMNFVDQQRANILKMKVTGLGLKIEDLDIAVNDDKVTVSGKVGSQEDREKLILAVGNIDGIGQVEEYISVFGQDSNESRSAEEIIQDGEALTESQFYEVKKGDSLSKIAKEVYGDAMKYPVIFEANKPMLSDPDKIYPGQQLRIPPLQA